MGMSLTYQPFESSPELRSVASDLKMNVGDTERVLGGIAAFGLLAAATRARGTARWSLLAAGVGMLARSWSGRCPWYRYQELDRRHQTSGVPGNRGIKIMDWIEVNRAPEVLFHFWRDLEQLPQVMPQIASVKQYSGTRSRWKMHGPLGQTVEWDAEIVNEEAPRLIAWQSLPGASVQNAGSVWFEPTQYGTRVKVSLEFDPPAGKAGAILAEIFGHSPEAQLAEALANFKQFAERELEPVSPAARPATGSAGAAAEDAAYISQNHRRN
jgi:uncharacterized membrane protein